MESKKYLLRFRAVAGKKEKSVTFEVPEAVVAHLRDLAEEQMQSGITKFRVSGTTGMRVELSVLNFEETF